jgi:hypothetical protein
MSLSALKSKKIFFGPFYRSSKEDNWHWYKSCPEFPVNENPETMICSNYPEESKLCKKCLDIEIKNSSREVA